MDRQSKKWLSRALATFLIAMPFASAHAQSSRSGVSEPVVRLGGDATAPSVDELGDDSASDLARRLQNPLADLISVPIQNNINFNLGPNKGTQNILNIQPVVPIHLNKNWNLITRTVLSLVWNPSLQPGQSVPFGAAFTTFSAFLSPTHAVVGNWFVGIGPVIQIPTATSSTLGSNVWGIGPAAVAVHIGGRWVYGAMVNNVFSLGGRAGGATVAGLAETASRYSTFTLLPFVNYNFGDGWSVSSAPVITANWYAAGNKAWTLPVGAQVGKLVLVGGKLPVNMMVGVYYNALRPQFGSTWQLRTQLTFVF